MRSLTRPSLGVNISELARKIATDMDRAAQHATRRRLENPRPTAFKNELYCIARRRMDGSYELETIEPVTFEHSEREKRSNAGTLKVRAPELESAKREMLFQMARAFYRFKAEPDMQSARRRAREHVTVHVADVLGER